MRILIDVNHPAHVHLFRCAAQEWAGRGHEILWTARDKDLVISLLEHYEFEFQVLSTYRRGLAPMGLDLVSRDWKLLHLVRRVRPDVMLGTSVNITHVSKLTPAHSIFFTESDPHLIRLIAYLSFPFADVIVTPDILPNLGRKHVRHTSYHELAYLHPTRFAPDASVLDDLGVEAGQPFFVLRFIAWGASHDIGEQGLTLAARNRIIDLLAPHGRIFITAESELRPEFEPYRLPIGPHRIHDALYYATMFIGDSQSMAIEAAALGTPALRCNSMVGRTAVIDELENKYRLGYGFLPYEVDKLLAKILELLRKDDLKAEWQARRRRLLSDKTDLTEWMVEYIESYGSQAW